MSFANYVDTIYKNNILPTIPPGAPISPNSKIDSTQTGKIPGMRTANGWTGFVDWPNYSSTAVDLVTWEKWKSNISLNCKDMFVGFDVDTEDTAFKQICLNAIALYIYDKMPLRARSNSARILLVFAGNVRKRALKFVNERTGESAGIDILGNGSQFVIEGTHPSGGQYHWPEGELYEYSETGDLPEVDEFLIDQILEEIITRATNIGWVVTQGNSRSDSSGDNVDYLPATYEGGEWLDVNNMRMLSVNMRQMIKNGVDVGNRSNAIASVIHNLIGVGFTDNQIALVLLNPAHGIGDKCRENGTEWTMKDIARCRGKFRDVPDNAEAADTPDESKDAEVCVDELSEDSLLSSVEQLERGCATTDIEPILERLAKVENKLLKENVLNAIKRQTGVAKGILHETIRQFQGGDDGDDLGNGGAPTHNQLARRYIAELVANECRTVYFADQLYQLGDDMIWAPKPKSEAMNEMTALMDGEQNFTRNGDYKAVNECYCRNVENENFLLNRPDGIAMADGYFYSLRDGKLHFEPTADHHHVTWASDVAPDQECSGENWFAFLDRAFDGPDKEGQIRMVREIIALILLGRLTHSQYAVLLHGPGATGKTVFLQVLGAIFPKGVVGSVPPHQWSQEYYLAAMADLYLNIIGEIPEEKAIEGESFKKYFDRLAITARHPSGRPFQFVPKASVVMNANSYPYLKDKSDAMMRRMLILQFRNIIPEHERRADYADELIAELPFIVWWALTGVKEIIEPSQTTLDSRLEWAGKSNNVLEFLHDDHLFVKSEHSAIPLPTVYEYYKAYCKMSSYRPYGRNNFNSLLKEAADVQRTFHKDHYPSGNLCLRGFTFANGAVAYVDLTSNNTKPAFSMLQTI